MLEDKNSALAGNLTGAGGNPAAAQAVLRRPGTQAMSRPQFLGQGISPRKGSSEFEDIMAAGQQSQNRIIADVLDGPVSNQTQRQLARLQAMNGRNPVLDDFEKGAREAAVSESENAAPARRPGPAPSGENGKEGSDARNSAAAKPGGATGEGLNALGPASGVGLQSSSTASAAVAAPSSEGAPRVRRGSLTLSAGPTILKGQGTGSIFNAARMAAYRQRYGSQLSLPPRARPDPIPLGAAERNSAPPAPPARRKAANETPKPILKGSIPAVAAELAKSEGGRSSDYDATIKRAANALGLDPALIKAVVKTESNFNPRAVSGAGAKGLMQLMPGTAKEMGVENPFDPLENIWGGARYLKRMLDRHGGNIRKALASYNWGPGNFDRHGSGNLPGETRRYIEVVTSNYNRYKIQGSPSEA
ncbi:MAG: lytic transglycosylase domain-containing protein [Deltaproteobacteria bacterium]|jgi:soluble lytic murein transglycosylase-like protein|nr:lytic transglycosylase domain-containing protein [Deltaproteobacteria bacterium]